MKHFICNNDAVTGSEAVLYVAGEVQALLDKNKRIAAVFFGFLILLKNVGAILLSAVLHFAVVVGEASGWICNIPAQSFFYKVGAQFMAVCAFLGIG
jgi:hypothetical protein